MGINIPEEKPKPLPPPATPVHFPAYDFLPNSAPGDEPSLSFAQVQHLFKIRRLQELTPDHLRALKVRCSHAKSVEELIAPIYVPPAPYASKDGLEQLSKGENSTESGSVAQRSQGDSFPVGTLSNGRQRPSLEDVERRMKELAIANDDAYQGLTRGPARSGPQTAKILHFRRLWSALQQLGGYWDTSHDDEAHGWTASVQPREPSTEADEDVDPAQHRYPGRRFSTGSATPPHVRTDVATAFLEPWAQLFGCCVERTRPGGGPNGPARVHLGKLRTAVEHTAVVHRVPRDPAGRGNISTRGRS